MKRPPPAADDRDTAELERVRGELRQLGYLTHRFDRFLLQDGLRPQAPWHAVLRVAGKVGLLSGVVLAVANAVALAAANASLAASPLDLVPLVAHLLVPLVVGSTVLMLALAGGLLAWLRFSPVRRIEAVSFGVAAVATTALAALALWLGRGLPRLLPPWQLAAAALAAPVVGWALTKVFEDALLALAIRLTRAAPAGGQFGRRSLGIGLAALALLLLVPFTLAVRRQPPAAVPASFPQAPGDRVLLVGLDGVRPEELDYLLARGDLPALAALARGGALSAYPREAVSPPTFWTTVATGVAARLHGVTALDSFRPLGVATPLARSGPWRIWWSGVAEPLGLAEYRPLLAGRRRAPAAWELAARGGEPVVAVNWWATFPAEELPGLVVAHGASQLLADGVAGAVAPPARAESLAERARVGVDTAAGALLRAALPDPEAERILARAAAPDAFYRAVFEGEAAGARAAALYLPALDIAAESWPGSTLAFGDLVRHELVAADALIGRVAAGFGTVVVVADPGRRGAAEGRILLWRAAGCGAAEARGVPWDGAVPAQVAAALIRALGLPQSRELPEPPAACVWSSPPVLLATFGERHHAAAASAAGAEYLQSLRALGYL